MSTANSSTSSTDPCLDQGKDNEFFNQMSIGPALVIVIVLGFMKKRAKLKRDLWNGRPGIQPPVDFLGDEQNRYSYAFAYGAMAVSVANIFINTNGSGVMITLTGSPYIKVFQSIVTVVSIGTIYLPMFMGMSTNSKILGAILGFFYTGGRFGGLIKLRVDCPFDVNSRFKYYPILYDIPAMMCHFVVLVRFLVILVRELRDKCYKKKCSCHVLFGEENDFEVSPHYINHVKTLLQGAPKTENISKWYIKSRNFVYTPEPHFKFSVAILSTVVVSSIIIYEFVIVVGGVLVGYLLTLRENLLKVGEFLVISWGEETYDMTMKMLDIFIASFVVSCVLSALFTYFQMYRMLVSHRNHVIKLIKADRSFLPRKLQDPHVMAGMSLRFCGYQIAYFLWGFLVLMGALVILVCAISAAILFLPMIMGDNLGTEVSKIAIGLIPTVAMAVLVWLVQQILARFVFKDRSIDSKVVNIDNRRCFLLLSFYFFFFNVLVGLISCFLRIVKGAILGVLFIGRIDRPLIMKGFTNFDTAYVAYVGFLHVQAAHKHPVVLVFSHLLWTGMRKKRAQRLKSTSVDVDGIDNETNGWTELREAKSSRPRVSASALNKWFIAVTVIRNPTLIFNRKGFLKHILFGMPNSPTPSHQESQSQDIEPNSNSKDVDVEAGVQVRVNHGGNSESVLRIENANHEKSLEKVIVA